MLFHIIFFSKQLDFCTQNRKSPIIIPKIIPAQQGVDADNAIESFMLLHVTQKGYANRTKLMVSAHTLSTSSLSIQYLQKTIIIINPVALFSSPSMVLATEGYDKCVFSQILLIGSIGLALASPGLAFILYFNTKVSIRKGLNIGWGNRFLPLRFVIFVCKYSLFS